LEENQVCAEGRNASDLVGQDADLLLQPQRPRQPDGDGRQVGMVDGRPVDSGSLRYRPDALDATAGTTDQTEGGNLVTAGEAICVIRKSAGDNQRAAAKLLRISVPHLCNVEGGKSIVTDFVRMRVETVYGYDPVVLAVMAYGAKWLEKHRELLRAIG
jgi:hypothetical protein